MCPAILAATAKAITIAVNPPAIANIVPIAFLLTFPADLATTAIAAITLTIANADISIFLESNSVKAAKAAATATTVIAIAIISDFPFLFACAAYFDTRAIDAITPTNIPAANINLFAGNNVNADNAIVIAIIDAATPVNTA